MKFKLHGLKGQFAIIAKKGLKKLKELENKTHIAQVNLTSLNSLFQRRNLSLFEIKAVVKYLQKCKSFFAFHSGITSSLFSGATLREQYTGGAQ